MSPLPVGPPWPATAPVRPARSKVVAVMLVTVQVPLMFCVPPVTPLIVICSPGVSPTVVPVVIVIALPLGLLMPVIGVFGTLKLREYWIVPTLVDQMPVPAMNDSVPVALLPCNWKELPVTPVTIHWPLIAAGSLVVGSITPLIVTCVW